jgi:hypothetical protein
MIKLFLCSGAAAVALAGVLAFATVVAAAATALALARILALAIMGGFVVGLHVGFAGMGCGQGFRGESAGIKSGHGCSGNEETGGFVHLIWDFGFSIFLSCPAGTVPAGWIERGFKYAGNAVSGMRAVERRLIPLKYELGGGGDASD